jgi:gamma-tubulin complex component 5
LKRQRRDVVGFSNTIRELREVSSDSDTDSDNEANMAPPEPSFSYAESTSISFAEESFFSRVDKMSLELDGLVRFVRRGVESLAGGSAEVAPTFGILAFNLEDWDRG